MFPDTLDDVHKFNFAGDGVPMKDERHSIISIPAIQFNAPASHSQAPGISFNTAGRLDLVSGEIRIMRGGNVVV